MFRGAKAKGGFRERILASRKMNVMQKMKMAAKAFSSGSSSFRRYSLEIVRPQVSLLLSDTSLKNSASFQASSNLFEILQLV